MDDYIHRQPAIDVLEERLQANGYSNAALVSELNRIIGYLMRLPSEDAKPVTHCKDCLFGHLRKGIIRGYEDAWIECINPNGLNRDVPIDGYCSAGIERSR